MVQQSHNYAQPMLQSQGITYPMSQGSSAVPRASSFFPVDSTVVPHGSASAAGRPFVPDATAVSFPGSQQSVSQSFSRNDESFLVPSEYVLGSNSLRPSTPSGVDERKRVPDTPGSGRSGLKRKNQRKDNIE